MLVLRIKTISSYIYPTNRVTLSNGHTIKDSSPNTGPLTGNSTQATSVDEFETSDVNGINGTAVKANNVPGTLSHSVDQPIDDIFNTSPPIVQPSNHVDSSQEEGADHLATPSVSSAMPQQPMSDMRNEPHPITQEQATEIKEQKQQEDLQRDPELANGLESNAPHIPADSSTLDEAPNHQSAQNKADSPQLLESASSIPTTDLPHHPSARVPEGTEPEAAVDLAPSPQQPQKATPSQPNLSDKSTDLRMPDVPPSPAKVAREREEDDADYGPASKRSKMEESGSAAVDGASKPEFKVPSLPEINTNVSDSAIAETPTESRLAITNPQKKFLSKVVQNIKRSKDAQPFVLPVDVVALNIPTYLNIVTKPMDLKTLEESLKADSYPSVEAFKSDFEQIITNTSTFNGQEHPITQGALKMKASFDRQITNLPGSDVVESTPSDKKSRKASFPTAPKVAPPRRESRSSLPASAKSPPAAGSPQTFALGPQGLPLIRRDSTKGDGRPKREIHPPAPRDLPYANQKPKKKKYQAELRFCSYIMNELVKPKYAVLTQPFAIPVDPVALNIPDYHSVIKKPMDLRTVREKLDNGQYENAKEFESDVRLIFLNCAKYNGADHPIRLMANDLEAIFDGKLAEKRQWIEANTVTSAAQSPTSSDVEDYDEEEEEEEEEQDPDVEQLAKLQQSIAAMSKQVEMLTQKKKSPPVLGKKAAKASKPDKKASKKAPAPPPAKPEKKTPAKSTSKREAYVTYEQKQDISQRINNLSEPKMAIALKIIRDNMPNLKVLSDVDFCFPLFVFSFCFLSVKQLILRSMCRMTSWNSTLTSFPMRLSASYTILSRKTHRGRKKLLERNQRPLLRPRRLLRARRTNR